MNAIQSTEIFDDWFADPKDRQSKAAISVRVRRAEFGNFGDARPVGEGVSEMRIHIDISAGYRVYYKQVGMEIYLLLVGGDKSSQVKDIQQALTIARELGA